MVLGVISTNSSLAGSLRYEMAAINFVEAARMVVEGPSRL